jgi:predicted PurR-regulated permease PerM
VEANIVTPAILGRRLTLDPFLVILALLIGAWLWGIAGALLAVPLLLFAAAAWRAYLGAKPAPAVQAAPEATLAQPANPTRA